MRFFQATGPLTLAPGEFQSVVVAYIFAAPVAAAAVHRRRATSLPAIRPSWATQAAWRPESSHRLV